MASSPVKSQAYLHAFVTLTLKRWMEEDPGLVSQSVSLAELVSSRLTEILYLKK